MIAIFFISASICIFSLGVLFGAWWVSRAHAIHALESEGYDGDGEPRGGDNVIKFVVGYQPTGKFNPNMMPPNMGSGVRKP